MGWEEDKHPRGFGGKFAHEAADSAAKDAVKVTSRRRNGDAVTEKLRPGGNGDRPELDVKTRLLRHLLAERGTDRYAQLLGHLQQNNWILNEDEAARKLGVNRAVLTLAYRKLMHSNGQHQPLRVGRPNNRGISSLTVPTEWQAAVTSALKTRPPR
jgi:hypothetical protein